MVATLGKSKKAQKTAKNKAKTDKAVVELLKRVIPVDRLPKNIGATSLDILKVIALHLGENEEARVEYALIGRSINKSRETVRKSVNRMLKAKILRSNAGKLSIPCSILINV